MLDEKKKTILFQSQTLELAILNKQNILSSKKRKNVERTRIFRNKNMFNLPLST